MILLSFPGDSQHISLLSAMLVVEAGKFKIRYQPRYILIGQRMVSLISNMACPMGWWDCFSQIFQAQCSTHKVFHCLF